GRHLLGSESLVSVTAFKLLPTIGSSFPLYTHIPTRRDMAKKFPEVQPGGSLILAWQAKDKKILVVGGGEVAAGRILNCLNADAKVTVVCPASGLNEEVAYRVSENQVTHVDRVFEPSDLDGADMVLVAIDDPAASTVIWKLCKEKKVPANIADVPPECDFYFGSTHRDGPLQIMVSTNGKGPRLAASIRRFIGDQLPKNAGNAIESIGELRTKLRKIAPKPEDGPKRMRWMSKVSDTYQWEEMCKFTEEDLDNLLLFYPPNKVPSMDILLALRGGTDVKKLDVFDGSFGFSVGA
ncbi:Siroheme biosynthesis protein met8, partial [Tolypocladium ophioglossoides CBS 100239]